MVYFLLIIGFLLVIKGADYLVEGASSLAKKLGVSALVIGLTVVSFGTSAPELIVNIFASLRGNTDIAIGNIVGSNIVNILFILGVAGVIFPLKVTKGTAWKEIPLSLAAVLVIFFVANDRLIDGKNFSDLSRSEGLILLIFFIIFLYYTFAIAKVQGQNETNNVKERKTWLSLLMIAGGLVGLFFGGKWIVESATTIARSFGVSESLIGLTIVAIGTSLPELATSAMAAYKKNVDIAVGNVVGSNIFNIFFVLGVSSLIKPLPLNPIMNFDLLVLIATTLLLFLALFIGKRHVLERWQGGLFIACYAGYIVYLIIRG